MLFNSLHYLFFFPLVALLYYLSPHRLRWVILLISSCYFYMSFIPKYILILFGIIGVDYFAALRIEKAPLLKHKKLWLSASLFCNLSVLFLFKYYGFFVENFEALGKALGLSLSAPVLALILPMGLSFHTFQALSYTMEVYYGNFKAERHLGIYAVYVLFFPQLVAGPIERPQNLLPQLHKSVIFSFSNAVMGLRLIFLGLIKKILIADNLSPFVEQVYSHPAASGALMIVAATYFFAIQIYCDFSGYTDIALGSAKFLGIDLIKNFNRPYTSQTIVEFWKRWHISLTTWFRDYLYVPLVFTWGRRSRYLPHAFLIFVFLVSGLWHGANWTYVLWGGFHGFLLVGSSVLNTRFPKLATALPPFLRRIICFQTR